jgi:hypothetical protein
MVHCHPSLDSRAWNPDFCVPDLNSVFLELDQSGAGNPEEGGNGAEDGEAQGLPDERVSYPLSQVDSGTAVADMCRQMGIVKELK